MFYRITRLFLFKFSPERAHAFTIKFLKFFSRTWLDFFYRQELPNRPVECMGINFRNPVGLAAGWDKNGECIEAFDAMGFGFIEVGTVTPRPQFGSEKPRIFRLLKANGIINRMGFNSVGVDHFVENIKNSKFNCVLGINIGKNKDTPIEEAAKDYLFCMEKVYEHADYITINISSPNTANLCSLQYGENLDQFLSSLKLKQNELSEAHGKYVPLALKISPDLNNEQIAQVSQLLIKNNIDAVIATNTSLDRSLVRGMKHSNEAGGLSGRPIQYRSTDIVRCLHKELDGKCQIIGVGGIDSCVSAREKLIMGASLIQIYSGFVYHGPKLLREIVENL
ncbi:dihydroorotate dehydrogenase [Candidatus Photodesmus blepharus]|uniref:Dihydroorotate dehydrogenase (quinone) n=1 Tax=Candidatus Photodesmus blepharonis TaxID=1179155 RepID=A0A084CNE7_9GAMM|nr:quinone-dependent dihydroorotate dehydrogenase [Candidatus Photodesmus blepharus]KEY91326.1 dihydroorotate dehydrogenase [Candidatus Photodesmus blepharus]